MKTPHYNKAPPKHGVSKVPSNTRPIGRDVMGRRHDKNEISVVRKGAEVYVR